MSFICNRKWQKTLVISISVILVLSSFFWGYAHPVSADPRGYTFTAPSDISLGNMAARVAPYTGSASGNLTGDNANGYTVTAVDAKPNNTGYMVNSSNVLHNKFQIGNSASSVADSDTARTLLNISSPPTNVIVPLYVSQQIAYNDPIATQYRITITFTVLPK